MFTPDKRVQLLNQVRIMLPFKTGNLRYNGTRVTGNQKDFSILIGGVRADYAEALEEEENSIWYLHINDDIVPHLVGMSRLMMANKPYVNKYRTRGTQSKLDREINKNIVAREMALVGSLVRQGVALDESIFRN